MDIDLFESVEECGCAAKVPAQALAAVVKGIELPRDPFVLVGPETLDDAGIYRISDEQCLVQTLDFFPPIARDPVIYGRIAAANSLSDVYAMGGVPKTALAIVTCPSELVKEGVLGAITRGAAEKLKEAGCVLLGGHSVLDPLLKFGLSVTGLVQEKDLFSNATARPGDVLFLTKPLGTGLTTMAVRAGMATQELEAEGYRTMASLNDKASALAHEAGASCVTDVTGFGLLGHAMQLAQASSVALEFHLDSIATLDQVRVFANDGLLSAAVYNNASYVGNSVSFGDGIELADKDILFDPQTSGGLLVCCPPDKADWFQQQASKRLDTRCSRVGRVLPPSPEFTLLIVKKGESL